MSLERALELAERGRGKTGTRPVVGAVVVRDGEIVGEGWYEEAGVTHAEPRALAQAGERARGATFRPRLPFGKSKTQRHGEARFVGVGVASGF